MDKREINEATEMDAIDKNIGKDLRQGEDGLILHAGNRKPARQTLCTVLGFKFSVIETACRLLVAAVVIAGLFVAPACAYTYDASDFATEVVSYVQGSGVPRDWITGEFFNDPATALGRPTVDSMGDAFYIPPD